MAVPRLMTSVRTRTPPHAITPAAPQLRAAPSLCAHSCSRATRHTRRHKRRMESASVFGLLCSNANILKCIPVEVIDLCDLCKVQDRLVLVRSRRICARPGWRRPRVQASHASAADRGISSKPQKSASWDPRKWVFSRVHSEYPQSTLRVPSAYPLSTLCVISEYPRSTQKVTSCGKTYVFPGRCPKKCRPKKF